MFLFFQNKSIGILYHLSKLKLNVNWSSWMTKATLRVIREAKLNLLEEKLFLVIYKRILTTLSKIWQFAELNADVGRPGSMYVDLSAPESR